MPPRLSYSGELARKALHLPSLSIPIGALLLGKTTALWIVAPLALVAITADTLRSRSPSFNAFIVRFLGFMMRPAERNHEGGLLVVNGATWVLVGAALTLALFPVRIAAAALCMFLLGDAVAAIVGRPLGRTRFPWGDKSLEGSLAFLAIASLVALWLPGPTYWIGFAGALSAMVLEALPVRINDNVVVPLGASLVMLLLSMMPMG